MLSYNGINLNVTKLHTYRRESVWSGNDYVHTKVTLVVTATLNPGTGAYALPGRVYAPPPFTQPPVNPVVGQPTKGVLNGGLGLGVWTDEAVRSVLMAPRKTLRYDMDGQVVLFAPLPGFSADAFNGPKPLFVNVTKNIATKTWVVDFGVEVYLNECNLFSSGVSPLVSYQYEMDHTVDSDFFTTRIIRGRALFRPDILIKDFPGSFVDDFRLSLFHAIPKNFRREKIYVKAAENGAELNIVIVDKETALNINPNIGVTRIEGTHEFRITAPNFEDKAAAAGGKFWEGVSKESVLEPFAVIRSVTDAAGELWGALARSIHRVTAKVWGNRNSTRAGLVGVAVDLVNKRLSAIQNQVVSGFDFVLREDYAGKYVEAEHSILAGPIATGGLVLQTQSILAVFPATDDTGTTIVNSNQTTNPAPTGDGLSRGSYLEILATSILKDQCSKPTIPPTATRTVGLQRL